MIKEFLDWLKDREGFCFDHRLNDEEKRELSEILADSEGELYRLQLPIMESALTQKLSNDETMARLSEVEKAVLEKRDDFITIADYYSELGVEPNTAPVYQKMGEDILHMRIPRRVLDITSLRIRDLQNRISSEYTRLYEPPNTGIRLRMRRVYDLFFDTLYFIASEFSKVKVRDYEGAIKTAYSRHYQYLRALVEERKPYYADAVLGEYCRLEASFHQSKITVLDKAIKALTPSE